MEIVCERCDYIIATDDESDGLVSYKERCQECEHLTDQEVMDQDPAPEHSAEDYR